MCLSGEGPLKGKEVLLSVIAGSISYGLNTKDSDVDIRGVFAHPVKDILVGEYEKVIQEDNNDTIYTEIGTLTVKCNPILRQFLLKIRNGDFEYDYLMELANEKSLELKELFNTSKLPEEPDKEFFKNYILNFYE